MTDPQKKPMLAQIRQATSIDRKDENGEDVILGVLSIGLQGDIEDVRPIVAELFACDLVVSYSDGKLALQKAGLS